MPVPVISGYNAQLDQFIEFAQQQSNASTSKAIIRASQPGDLSTRTISIADKDKVGGLSALFRSRSDKTGNNQTREMFLRAVADLFNGEDHIPPNVMKALEKSNFEKDGKPLTARRIMAVKTAIDDTIATREQFSPGGFADTKEITDSFRAANFYMAATNCTKEEAAQAVSTPGSPANRLMLYGGRFLTDLKSFSQGLNLLENFSTWFDQVIAEAASKNKTSPTAVHMDTTLRWSQGDRPGVERFVFDELAADPNLDLSKSPEELFGLQNNKAMRFAARGFVRSAVMTLLQIPHEHRTAVYDALECLWPLGSKGVPNSGHPSTTSMDFTVFRVLRNLDKVKSLMDKGRLNAETLRRECFADIPFKSGKFNLESISMYLSDSTDDMCDAMVRSFLGKGPDYILKEGERSSVMETHGNEILNATSIVTFTMLSTGCTLNEAVACATTGKPVPLPKFASHFTCKLSDLNDTTAAGLTTITEDLKRADTYRRKEDSTPLLDDSHFTVAFPGQAQPLVMRNGSEHAAEQGRAVHDKVVDLCGRTHPRQALAVMFGLSQSALGNLRGGLLAFGISSNEHSAVDFTLSRDDFTGAVTIRYDSPQGCPVKFSWTTTVDVYGRSSSTPMVIERT